MLQRFSLKMKILSGILLVCVGMCLIAGIAVVSLSKVVAKYDTLATLSVPALGHISGMRARSRQIHAETIKLALYSDNKEETVKTLESLTHAIKRYEAISQEYLAVPFSEGEEQTYKEIDELWKPLKKTVEESLEIFHSNRETKVTELKAKFINFEEQVRKHQESILKLDDFHVSLGEKNSKESREIASLTTKVLIGIALVLLVVALIVGFWLTSHIISVINDVTTRLTSSAEKLTENSKLVAEASEELADGTSKQAEAFHETVASSDEISAMTKKSSDLCEKSLTKTELSKKISEEGRASMEQMVDAINKINLSNQAINHQVRSSNDEIREIAKLIVGVAEKTKIIDDIVFQTKLLSFNASVEAARAGDLGKGFAVVAEEVSLLANMSGKASKEIEEILTTTIQKSNSIIESSEKNIEVVLNQANTRLKEGGEITQKCSESLKTIAAFAIDISQMVKEIAHATQEQSIGVNDINKAMTSLDGITNQNSTAAQQCSEAASFMFTEVEKTRGVINDLIRVVEGERG